MIHKATRAVDVDLLQLLGGIGSGEVVLPNFQRDFDWTVSEVRSLLGTVLRGWPLGSLLLIEGAKDRDFYDPRPFELGGLVATNIDYIVLDGQQRLTALYQAIKNKGDLVYAVRITSDQALESIEELDAAIVAFKRTNWNRWPTPRDQWQAGVIPIWALADAGAFYDWRDKAIPATEAEESQRVTAVYRNHLAGLHNYEVPAVVIGKTIGPEAVARIFERVNRTGVKLGAFDLMVAKSFSSGFNLRRAWDELQADDERLKSFLRGDGLPLLTTMALRQRNDVRQSAVLALTGSAIADGWETAAEHFRNGLEFAARHLGVLQPDWLAYKTILPVLAAIDFDWPLESNLPLVQRWYWATVVGRRYNEGANTTAVADFRLLRVGEDPITRPAFVVRELALESTRGQQGAFHRAFLASLAKQLVDHQVVARSNGSSLRADTVFGRGDLTLGKPAMHLRTLGHYLWLVEDDARIESPDLQYGDLRGAADSGGALEGRLELFLDYVQGLTRGALTVISADEAELAQVEYSDDDELGA